VDAVPVIGRGHNVAVLVPPVSRALRALLEAVPKRPLLILATSTERALDLATAAGPQGVSVAAAKPREPYPGDHSAVAVGAGEALALLTTSALHPAAFAAVVLAWPEELDEEGTAALATVMAECDKDAQRIVVTADAGEATRALVDRYAFKAMTYGFPADGTVELSPVGPARYLLAGEAALARTLLQARELVPPGVAVAECPVSRGEAATLASAEPPLLVLTPQQLPWARRTFKPLTPMPLPGAIAGLHRRSERLRSRLEQALEVGGLDGELFILAPLLERHDPVEIAAAALRLAAASSSTVRAEAAETVQAAQAAVPAYARIWVGIGKKDNVRPGDLVGALTREVGLPAEAIGRIETRDLFCLVEVRADQAEAAVKGLTGISIRGRRLSARVDRGPGPMARPPRRA
jgi:hypothetical protein